MVHRCCISSCGMNVRVVEAKGLSYHKFPTKEAIKDQWVQAIIPHLDRPDAFKVVPRYTRVCSRHFRKKDYCMDSKKRARLNTNAVPSVFPRKNTPLVVQSVLPVSPKLPHHQNQNQKASVPAETVTTASISISEAVCSSSSTSEAPIEIGQGQGPGSSGGSTIVFDDQSGNVKCETHSVVEFVNEDGSPIEFFSRNELLIESATIQDDHLVLTVMDSKAHSQTEGEFASLNNSNSDDQSVISTSVTVDDGSGSTKRRKRRKWNRTAFARPAKGKRKSFDVKPEPNVDQDEEDDEQDEKVEETELGISFEQQSQSEPEENESLQNVTLLLSDLPDQPYQATSIEQELLQSIQAVSLRCVGDDGTELHHSVTDDHLNFSNLQLVPAFLHHHSSEESLFSNESQSQTHHGNIVDDLTVTQPEVSNNEDDSLRFELVDLRIDPDIPPVPPPTYLDIDELAHQLNSSLFTDGKLSLFDHDSLHLSSDHPPDLNLGGEDLIVTTDNEVKHETGKEKKTSTRNSQGDECDDKDKGSRKAKSPRLKAKTGNKVKKSAEKKLKGVSKRPKKDKISGKFSVERFKNSDKDIEYYTGFNSYRNFEAFFRSLEAYIERLCITDATYGINNLPNTSEGSSTLASADAVAISSNSASTSSEQQPKKRSCQGRSMTRINELFMTIIRLRRKLPEKVLGHMFFISQPTVSRVVRAWTVLLSKIIDSYPTENSVNLNTKYAEEHSYPTKGLGIPDAFRDLFYSDLAKSIVVTSLNPKKVKSKANNSNKASKSKPSG